MVGDFISVRVVWRELKSNGVRYWLPQPVQLPGQDEWFPGSGYLAWSSGFICVLCNANTYDFGDFAMFKAQGEHEHCVSCVYYPPNLPASGYSEEDFSMLQAKRCSFDFQPEDDNCHATRKTSCSLVDLEHLQRSVQTKGTAL